MQVGSNAPGPFRAIRTERAYTRSKDQPWQATPFITVCPFRKDKLNGAHPANEWRSAGNKSLILYATSVRLAAFNFFMMLRIWTLTVLSRRFSS